MRPAVRSRGVFWRNAMAAKTSVTMATVPAARPSSPSVRFTALLIATIITPTNARYSHGTTTATPPIENTDDTRPRSSLYVVSGTATQVGSCPQLTTSRPKITETVPCQKSLASGRRPSERSWLTFDQSSMKPRIPHASIARSARMLSRVGVPSMRNVAVTTNRMSTPPIVGVPCLTR